MSDGTPQDFERLHNEADDILRGGASYEDIVAGHPNTVGELTELSEQIVAEHEVAKASETHAAKSETGKLWKSIKAIGSGAVWIFASAGQTMRPIDSVNYPVENHRPR